MKRKHCIMCGETAPYFRTTGRCQKCEEEIKIWVQKVPTESTPDPIRREGLRPRDISAGFLQGIKL